MRPRLTAAALLPLALAALLPLSACSGLGMDSESSDPISVRSPAPAFEPGDASPGPTSAKVVNPGWDAAAQEAQGTFLSMHESEDGLEFLAVDSTGEILWSAKRPRVCSGFLVTSSQGGPVAVLMDQAAPSGDSLKSTASGYDLVTGEELWGPVETPGPLLGNGPVFAGPPKDFIGAGGPRTALDPSTGETLAAEVDVESSQVIAALGDHLIRSQGSTIIGEDLQGKKLWTRPFEDLGLSVSQAREAPWEPVGNSHAIVGGSGSEERTLLDLRSGTALDSDISEAGFDSSSNTLVTSGSRLRGFDDEGTKLWSEPLLEDAEVASVGAGLIEDEDPLHKVAEQLGAPHHISESGAALIGDPQSPLLATAPG